MRSKAARGSINRGIGTVGERQEMNEPYIRV
jgi:hypothetical protein